MTERASNSPRTMKASVVFFIPQTAVRPQFALTNILARLLLDYGFEIHLILCRGLLYCCPAMRCFGLNEESNQSEKLKICATCQSEHQYLKGYFPDSVNIHYLDFEKDSDIINTTETILFDYVKDNNSLLDFEYNSIKFGKIASTDSTLALKSLDLNRHENVFLGFLKDSLLTYFYCDRIISKIKPELFLHYNDYSICHSASQAALQNGSRTIVFSHASNRNVDFRKVNIFEHSTISINYSIQNIWKDWQELALTPKLVREVEEDALQRLSGRGSHVFSEGLSGIVDIPLTDSPVLVAFTSSPDEVFAGFRLAEALGVEVSPPRYTFGTNHEDTQIEWLRALAAHSERKGYTLIVRVHPREGKTRGGHESDHMRILREHLPHLPGSPFIVWPDDPTSSYDLAEAADLILTCWTSMAYELARIAAPALTASENVSFCPTDVFHPFTSNEKKYFELLEEKLRENPSFHTVKLAFRWWHLSALGGALDLSDLVFTPGYSGHPEYKFPKEAENLRNAIVRDGHSFDLNYERLLAAQTPDSEKEERAAILWALESVLRLLCFGKADSEDEGNEPLDLQFVSSPELDAFVPNSPNVVAGDGRDVVLLREGSQVKRRSPMINRIMSLLLTNQEDRKPS